MHYTCKQKLFLVILVINLLVIVTVMVVINGKSPFQAGGANLQLLSGDNTHLTVAIGGGITSNRLSEVDASIVVKKFPLFTMLLPSFCKTINSEWRQYVYHFYLAYDATDRYFSRAHNRKSFQTEFHEVIKQHCLLDTDCILHLLECPYSGRPAWAQNDAMIAAYMNGADYFYRLNDDTVLSTDNWLSAFTTVLSRYQPRNVGVVGPTHDFGNLEILTYDFVHRTHIEIFGFYYPRLFTDWFADDWITYVYAPQHVTKLGNVSIEHKPLLGQRYFSDPAKAKLLLKRIMSDRYTLARYVYHINHAIAALRRTTMIIAMSLASAELADLWGVVRNAQLIQVYFPGWTLRVYAKKPVTSATDSDSESIYATVISKLFALGADIVYVDTALTGIAAKWWSYMAVDDLNVDFALVRKPNSRLGEREAMAIKDWIHLCEKSRHVAVHCIRDSAYQGSRPMMHGLWGARPRVLHQLLGGHSLISLIDNFVNDSHRHDDELEPSDFLSQVLWPLVMPDSVVCHDSVTYDVWPNSHRFDHSQSQCVGAEYDAHEQTIAHCERHDLSLSNMVDIDDRLQLLV